MDNEIWKEIDFVKWFRFKNQPNTHYYVSDRGNIKSIDGKGKVTFKSTRPKSNDKSINQAYVFGAQINERKENLEVDICVACAFIDETRSFSKILFKDGNSANCELSNLTLVYNTALDSSTVVKLIAISKSREIDIKALINSIIMDSIK